MKKIMAAMLLCLMLVPAMARAQQRVVLITIDGYRWQELFGGADSTMCTMPEVGVVDNMQEHYWRPTQAERRQALMPFIWNYVASHGVIIGNRWKGCTMDVVNKMWFSYPGYQELLCGFPDDDHIRSNGPTLNPNVSVLEVANKQPQLKGRVLAFGSWERFVQILNEQRSGIEVNAGYRHSLAPNPSAREKYLDKLQDATPRYWNDERFDVFTHEYALEAMRTRHPDLLYIAYGDTDDWAHGSRYDLYLDAAHTTDAMIRELWEVAQSDPYYKDRTTFIITCDHGRGDANWQAWTSHGYDVAHSGQTWLIAFGAGIPARGELSSGSYHNNQVAATVASLLKLPFAPKHKLAGKPIAF